jgi:ABC-2 type transport system permease protein
MTENAPLRSSLAVESLLFASRIFTHSRRGPTITIQALVFPTFLLITYDLLVGKSMMRITGTDSLYGLVPMCAVAGGMFGALAASFTILVERDSGLLSRFWVMPVKRASALTGRLLVEAARTLVGSLLITAVGIGLGLRFEGGWLAAILFILMPVLVILVFSTALIAIAVRSTSNLILMWVAVSSIAAVFASSGALPPPEMLPSWMRPLIQLTPVSPTLEAMRALAQGRPALWPILLSLAWALGLTAVFGPLAVRGYRAAAESG